MRSHCCLFSESFWISFGMAHALARSTSGVSEDSRPALSPHFAPQLSVLEALPLTTECGSLARLAAPIRTSLLKC